MEDLSRREITQMVVNSLGLKAKSTIYPSTENMMFKCPFHKDNHPSLSISFKTGQYHCFSCGAGGNVEGLYRKVTGNSFYKDFNIKNDPFSNFARTYPVQSYEEDYELKVQPIEFDRSKTMSPLYNYECASYLRNRGIKEAIIKSSRMMYSENVAINGRPFKKRLLVPVYENKKLISIEGRRVVENDEPKVLYPRGSSVNTLYDLDNLDRTKPLYVVEGLMDLFVLRGCEEFKNSTSIFGAGLTNRQIHLLKDFSQIIAIPDLDLAGEKPLLKMKEIDRGQIFYLKVPHEINGMNVKDVGDLPKAGSSPEQLVERKWLSYVKPLDSFKFSGEKK